MPAGPETGTRDEAPQQTPPWTPQTTVDRLVVGFYRLTVGATRATIILLALVIFSLEAFAIFRALQQQPVLVVFFLVSVLPALAVAGYIWTRDEQAEPLRLLVLTTALGVLFATFAGVTNALGAIALGQLFPSLEAASPLVAFAAIAAFFFLVVGLGEEVVKWLAVRLYAYRNEAFSSPVDGAVYGAMAGLGFAIIENVLYVTRATLETVGIEFLASAVGIATIRAFVGPNHVIWSAIAGYYLGLAKFNPESRGPLIIKGIGTAAVFHGIYNTTAGIVLGLIGLALGSGIGALLAQFAYILLFATVMTLYLFRIIQRYGSAPSFSGRTPRQSVEEQERERDLEE